MTRRVLRTAPFLILVLALAACGETGAPAGAGDETAGTPAAAPAGGETAAPGSDDEKVLYAAGAILARNVADWKLSPQELDALVRGLRDAATGQPLAIPLDEYRAQLQAFAQERAMAAAEAEKKAAEPFLAEAAAAKGARKTDSGLVYIELEAGSGDSPKPESRVKVHYHGTLADGTVFDSSVDRGEPVTFPLQGVIPCWTEGLQLMKEGGKARLVCPSDIAYGDRGAPPSIKPGAALAFEVELIEIVDAGAAKPAAPAPAKPAPAAEAPAPAKPAPAAEAPAPAKPAPAAEAPAPAKPAPAAEGAAKE